MAAYKQPRRVNAVSVTLTLLLAAGGFLAFRAWPAVALRADVKDALEDALPGLYRANLLAEPDSSAVAEEVRGVLLGKLATLGVADAEKVLVFTRNSDEVAISVDLQTQIDLTPLRRPLPLAMKPRVSTSAAPVAY